MSYYTLLGFHKEPFSTSPDPEFLYLTKSHEIALTNILIELRLRRGLTVVFGDIGTGKTTLSRTLVQELRKRGDILFHMILNPAFATETQLLSSLVRNFNVSLPFMKDLASADVMELRDAVERFLIQKSVVEKKTIVLIVDEAQKLDIESLETLRLLLNFETNEYKLIQIVLLGQLELYPTIAHMPNFWDRISFRCTLNPLNLTDTRDMIDFRMRKAGYQSDHRLFLEEATDEIYRVSGGYPRKINMLCHQVLKELVVLNQTIVDRQLVRDVASRQQMPEQPAALRDDLLPRRWSSLTGQPAIG